jgi:anaerobic selenocysteine-containing dehydrogenase
MDERRMRTACSRDCPDACGIVATIAGDRVVKLEGDPEHPVTRGFLCLRTSRFGEIQHGAERLRTPLLRRGTDFVPIPIGEALDLAAEKLLRIRAESGPAAIFHYRSGGSLGLLKGIADLFFARFGPCTGKIGDICSGAGEAAQVLDFGVSDSNDLFDLRHSRSIFVWGKNPFVSNLHLIPVLREARARGARITLIDPVHHKGTALADRYLQPRPGGDLDLALGVGRALLDAGATDPQAVAACADFAGWERLCRTRTCDEHAAAADVPAAALGELAAELAGGPTAILVGWGMQRRRHGGAIVRALDALCAVSGNLARHGGGCSFYFKRRAAFDPAPFAAPPPPRVIREPLLGADLLAAQDPPIRAIWVTAGNPVSSLPDAALVAEAFSRVEFKVVVDPLLTDTGRRADLVIPVPTLLEDDDLLGAYGHHWLAESRPVLPPPPGVLHELVLFQELGRRVGLTPPLEGSIDDWKRRLLRPVAAAGAGLDDLRARGAVRNPLAPELRFAGHRVATPDGRVHLLHERPPEAPPEPDYPLWLFSNPTIHNQATVWTGDGLARTWVAVHPESAPPGRRDGDPVVVESRLGRLDAELRLDPAQRPDVAIMPKGGHLDRGHCANRLVPAVATDLGLGAAYLDCRVRLR